MSAREALSKLKSTEEEFAAIIVDYNLEGDSISGSKFIKAILSADSEAYVIVYSGDPSQEAVTESWSAGAVSFVKKAPGDALLRRIEEQCEKFDQVRSTLSPSQFKSPNMERLAKLGIVGRSKVMAVLGDKIELFRDSTEPVAIYGESGTGKELIAKALRNDHTKPFLPVNAAAFTNSELLEAELFGSEKGAFTGAVRKIGVLEAAQGGIVFLDEVHLLSPESQGKLLRAFQESTIRRVGGNKEYPVSFRLVTAAQSVIFDMVKNGTFREDFHFRIGQKLPIHVPPLRERREDIAPLIHHFTQYYLKKEGLDKRFRNRTVRIMEAYDWARNNVRELDTVVYRLMKTCPGKYVEPSQLEPHFFKKSESSQLNWDELQRKQFEERKHFLVRVFDGSMHKAHAARQLGVAAPMIHKLMRNYDIHWEPKQDSIETGKVILK